MGILFTLGSGVATKGGGNALLLDPGASYMCVNILFCFVNIH